MLVPLSGRLGAGRSIFVTLERQGSPDDEKWIPVAASPEPSAAPEAENRIVLHGTLDWPWASCPDPAYRNAIVQVKYGIESYFVPENTGRDLEQATRTGAVKAVISVDRDGNAAIKGLIVNGTRHDETFCSEATVIVWISSGMQRSGKGSLRLRRRCPPSR